MSSSFKFSKSSTFHFQIWNFIIDTCCQLFSLKKSSPPSYSEKCLPNSQLYKNLTVILLSKIGVLRKQELIQHAVQLRIFSWDNQSTWACSSSVRLSYVLHNKHNISWDKVLNNFKICLFWYFHSCWKAKVVKTASIWQNTVAPN